MRNRARYIILLVGIVVTAILYSFTFFRPGLFRDITYNPDSIATPQYIKRLITYSKEYAFIKYNQNYIEWNDYSSIKNFFEKLKKTPQRKLKVLHIGDSHVQADIFTGYIRNELQVIFGDGGRGFVFPYAAASTHAAYDYKTSCKGKWDYSRNVQPYPVYDLGITGATVHTEDSSASFKLVFSSWALKKNFNVLKIYCKRSSESFDLKLKTSHSEAPLYIDCNSFNDQLYIEIDLPQSSDTLEFFVNKTDTAQKYFECYGLLIETNEDKGILYNSVGINSAGLQSILREELLLYQLQELKPDLVVLDIGTNDFYKVKFLSDSIEKNLCKIIDIIQRASPDATIILSDVQDIYYRYWDEANCKTYSTLMREVAFRKGCAFYDYYYVAGGQYSMLKWLSNKLASYDRVHLNAAGYYVRGELFCNALLNSYYLSLTRDSLEQLIALKECPDTTKANILLATKDLPEIKDTSITSDAIQEQTKVWTTQTYYYTIKSGDVLGTIAKKYGVTVKQLQLWNALKSTTIMAGKTLVIYKQALTSTKDTPVYNTATTNTTTTNTATTSISTLKGYKYTVVKGDNLWNIAKKYSTTVEKIKTLNNMTDDKLKPGMVLKIK
ncbi:MAG: LysM peptidoglycan-binding domain-containing protein [Bacteroidota bacterium]